MRLIDRVDCVCGRGKENVMLSWHASWGFLTSLFENGDQTMPTSNQRAMKRNRSSFRLSTESNSVSPAKKEQHGARFDPGGTCCSFYTDATSGENMGVNHDRSEQCTDQGRASAICSKATECRGHAVPPQGCGEDGAVQQLSHRLVCVLTPFFWTGTVQVSYARAMGRRSGGGSRRLQTP